jgi:hypothetical protein
VTKMLFPRPFPLGRLPFHSLGFPRGLHRQDLGRPPFLKDHPGDYLLDPKCRRCTQEGHTAMDCNDDLPIQWALSEHVMETQLPSGFKIASRGDRPRGCIFPASSCLKIEGSLDRLCDISEVPEVQGPMACEPQHHGVEEIPPPPPKKS